MKPVLYVKLLSDNKGNEMPKPEKANSDDAARDLRAREIKFEEDHIKVYLGVQTKIPKGCRAVLLTRSSVSKHGYFIPHGMGLIDSSYPGEWILKLYPINYMKYQLNLFTAKKSEDYSELGIKVGDRCAQFFLEKELDYNIEYVDDLEYDSTRTGGFGSTGK